METHASSLAAGHRAAEDPAFPWPLRTYRGKRLLDVVGASLLLLIAAPLLPILALAVKLSSRGPVFYRACRAGQGGREFMLLKFRSMTVGGGSAITARNDARVTPVGRWLRRLKLDELPQLINVLRGEMSLVGPRPEDARIVRESYTREQLRVLSVPCGLTGLLQVRTFPDFSPAPPEGIDAETYYRQTVLPERLREDLEYVERMSLALDLRILAETAYCVLVKSWLPRRKA